MGPLWVRKPDDRRATPAIAGVARPDPLIVNKLVGEARLLGAYNPLGKT